MAPKYKLTYFNGAGVAEPIRYIFAYANKEFEDNRFPRDQWPALKAKTPFGKVPVLEIDGKQINQSVAIARYLAKQFGLTGKDEQEALQADVLVDTLGDYRSLLMSKFREKDEEKVAEIQKNEAFYLEKFDKIVSGNASGLLIGSQITWADLFFAAILYDGQLRHPDLFKPYPGLAKLVDKINNAPGVKAYLEKRPKSDLPPRGPPPKN